MTDTCPRIPWGTKMLYGVGALANAVKGPALASYLILYYNQVVGLSAITVTTVMMIALVLDAIFDPLIGQISDNIRSRWGRRLPFMYLSALPVSLLFLLLWNPPTDWSYPALTIYFALCLIGVRFFDTFFELPHLALVPELTPDYNDRTRLFTIRALFDTIGGLVATLLVLNVFLKERPDGSGGLLSADGYPGYALFASIVIFAAIIVCTAGLHRRIPHFVTPPARRVTFGVMLREMAATLHSRSFAVLAATAMFISIGAGIGHALSLYWTLYYYQLTQFQMSLVVVPKMIGMMALIATPLISARMGKRNAAILLCWIFLVASTAPITARLLDLIPAHSDAILAMVMFQSAIGTPAMIMVLIILSSMIADLVEDAEVRTGRRSEGLLLSANNLVRKATQGLGTLGAGVILMIVAFPVGAERHEVSPDVLTNMAVLYLVAKTGIFLAATACLLFYDVTRTTHEKNLRKLAVAGMAAE